MKTIFIVFAVVLLAAVFVHAKEKRSDSKENNSDSKEKLARTKVKHHSSSEQSSESSEESSESSEKLKEISKKQRKSNEKKEGSSDQQKDNPSSQQVERDELQGGIDWTGDQQGDLLGGSVSQKEERDSQEGSAGSDTQRYASPQGARNPQAIRNHQKKFYRTMGAQGQQTGRGLALGRLGKLGVPLLSAGLNPSGVPDNLLDVPFGIGARTGLVGPDGQRFGGEAAGRSTNPQGVNNPQEVRDTQAIRIPEKISDGALEAPGQQIGARFALGPLGQPTSSLGISASPLALSGSLLSGSVGILGETNHLVGARVGINEGGGPQGGSVGTEGQQGGGATSGSPATPQGASNSQEVRGTPLDTPADLRSQQVGSSVVQGQVGVSGSLLGGSVGILGETSRLVGARIGINDGSGPQGGSAGTEGQQGDGAARGSPATPQAESNSQEVRGTPTDAAAGPQGQQVGSSVVQGHLGVSGSLLGGSVGILGETSRLVGAHVGINEGGDPQGGSVGTDGGVASGHPATPQGSSNSQKVGESRRVVDARVGIKGNDRREGSVETVVQQGDGAANGRPATPQGASNSQEVRDSQVIRNPHEEVGGLPGQREQVGPNVVLGSQPTFGIPGSIPAACTCQNKETRWPLEAYFGLQGDRGLQKGLERIDGQQGVHHLQGVYGSQWERGSLLESRGLQGVYDRLQEVRGVQGRDGDIGNIGYLQGTRVPQEESGRPLGARGQDGYGVLLGGQSSYSWPLEARLGVQGERGLQREPEGTNVQQEVRFPQWERSSLLEARRLQGGVGIQQEDRDGRSRGLDDLQGTRVPQERLFFLLGGCDQQGAYGSQQSNRLQRARVGVQERDISEKTLGVVHLDIVFRRLCQ